MLTVHSQKSQPIIQSKFFLFTFKRILHFFESKFKRYHFQIRSSQKIWRKVLEHQQIQLRLLTHCIIKISLKVPSPPSTNFIKTTISCETQELRVQDALPVLISQISDVYFYRYFGATVEFSCHFLRRYKFSRIHQHKFNLGDQIKNEEVWKQQLKSLIAYNF